MSQQPGYIVCDETLADSTCVVTCAAGYTGTLTTYLCDGSQQPATFVAQSAVGTCTVIKLCSQFACGAGTQLVKGNASVACTDDAACQATCCETTPVPGTCSVRVFSSRPWVH